MFKKVTNQIVQSNKNIKQLVSSINKYQKSQETAFTETERDFLNPKDFYDYLTQKNVNFYTGVPDSLLSNFCGYVTDNTTPQNHVITANEGLAVSLATGYHLATGKFPLVYLQNSGLGNIVNPVMSLAHQQVYGIPMIFLIGWRGEPGKKDEPQHLIQGKTMNGILTEMGMQYEVLPDFIEGAEKTIDSAIYHCQTKKSPYALIVRRQCFLTYKMKNPITNNYPLNREQAINVLMDYLGKHDCIVGTTGFLSRELYEIRDQKKQGHEKDFLCVGSMGHASSIALGIAIQKPSRNVYCFDGDGAALMHLGGMASIGGIGPQNFKHVLFNNGAHDSVGAQPTDGFNTDFRKVAEAAGYKKSFLANNEEDIKAQIKEFQETEGPVFMEIRIRPGARKDLGRPKTSTIQNKEGFMNFMNV